MKTKTYAALAVLVTIMSAGCTVVTRPGVRVPPVLASWGSGPGLGVTYYDAGYGPHVSPWEYAQLNGCVPYNGYNNGYDGYTGVYRNTDVTVAVVVVPYNGIGSTVQPNPNSHTRVQPIEPPKFIPIEPETPPPPKTSKLIDPV